MENCIFNGQRICALDVRNVYGNENYDLKRKWKKAQYNNELICEDCGNPVELRVGDIKIPHFAHRKGFLERNCYYLTTKESEEHRKAKSIIYSYFKEKYPQASIQTSKKLLNDRRCDIYIEQENLKLAVEFQRKGLRVFDWDIRHEEYKKLGIVDFWILSSNIYEEREMDTDFLTQVLLYESRDNIAKFLDVDSGKLLLLKQIDYFNSDGILRWKKFFSKNYNLFNLMICLDGRIESDFEQLYAFEKDLYFKECQELESKELSLNKENGNQFSNKVWHQVPVLNKQKVTKIYERTDFVDELTHEEQQLELELRTKENCEFCDNDVIRGWLNDFNKILDISDRYKDFDHFDRIKSWCERVFQGYQYNKYITSHNAERLQLRLRLLNDIVSEN